MKRKKKKGCLTLLDFVEREETGYAFLCLQFERAIHYVIYIERGEECALELVGKQKQEAKEVFAKTVRGELSPIHLREVAEDAERARLEIFC